MAGRCLGELVRKMGGRVIHQIMPIMSAGIQSEAAETRQGVCWGLREVLENVTRDQLADHIGEILPTIQSALVDTDPGVRQAAGAAIGVLFKTGGGSGVDGVLPTLLAGIDGSPQQFTAAVEGLRVLLSVRTQTLNALVPKLLRPPLRTPAVRALGAVAQVTCASPAPLLSCLSLLLPLFAVSLAEPGGGGEEQKDDGPERQIQGQMRVCQVEIGSARNRSSWESGERGGLDVFMCREFVSMVVTQAIACLSMPMRFAPVMSCLGNASWQVQGCRLLTWARMGRPIHLGSSL